MEKKNKISISILSQDLMNGREYVQQDDLVGEWVIDIY